MDSIKESIDAGIAIGRQQAFAVIAAKCSAAQALSLKNIKESRVYEQLGFTWDQYCPEYFGVSRVTADRIINQLSEFGQSYFRLCELARISEGEFRQIASKVTAEAIEIDGESIQLTPENAPRIRQALRALRLEVRQAQSHFPPRSDTVSQLLTRLEALLSDLRSLDRPDLPAMERESLRALSVYAVKKWSEIARDYAKGAWRRQPGGRECYFPWKSVWTSGLRSRSPLSREIPKPTRKSPPTTANGTIIFAPLSKIAPCRSEPRFTNLHSRFRSLGPDRQSIARARAEHRSPAVGTRRFWLLVRHGGLYRHPAAERTSFALARLFRQ